MFEVWRLAIGRLNGAPVAVQPLLRVIDPDFLRQRPPRPYQGHYQPGCTLGTVDITTIAIGTFQEAFVFFDDDGVKSSQADKVCNGRQVLGFDENAAHVAMQYFFQM